MWNYETDTLCIDPVSVDIEVSIAVKVVLRRAVLDLLDLDDGGRASARTDWLGNLELTHWRVTGWVCAFLLLGFFRPIRQLIRFYCGVIRDLPAFGWWSQLPLWHSSFRRICSRTDPMVSLLSAFPALCVSAV